MLTTRADNVSRITSSVEAAGATATEDDHLVASSDRAGLAAEESTDAAREITELG